MPRPKPPVGTVFRIPLNDGGHAIGQVIAYEPQLLNTVSCIFTTLRSWEPGDTIPASAIIASLSTTHDLLTKGKWQLLGHAIIPIAQADFPNEHLRTARWVGAKTIGSANVTKLLNAWFGLSAWDDFAIPTYLDTLLVRGVKRPSTAIIKQDQAEHPTPPKA